MVKTNALQMNRGSVYLISRGGKMIDDIHLQRELELDTSRFNTNRFIYDEYSKDDIIWRLYKYNCSGVNISYSTITRKLKIEGRIYNLSMEPNRVDNLDRLYAGVISQEDESHHENLDDVLDQLNNTVYDLTGYRIDVRRFKVTYLEACFNLHTDQVDSYLKIFNEKFNTEKRMKYKNYVLENDLGYGTSFYIKTTSTYIKDNKSNYVVNFYNKHNQICSMINANKKDRYKAQATQEDIDKAKNILRLEIQCGYHHLRKIKKEYNIEGVFNDFIDIDLCINIVKDKYKFFIDKHEINSFYTYNAAISVIDSSNSLEAKDKRALKKYCLSLSQGSVQSQYKSQSTRKRYNDMLWLLGIHSFLIQPRYDICQSVLKSPMVMLDEYIESMKCQRQKYMQRYNIVK